MSTLQAQLCPECQTPSIKMLCPTHWTVRTKALEAIIKNYSILIAALIKIQNRSKDKAHLKAGGFLQSLEKYSISYGLKLSRLINVLAWDKTSSSTHVYYNIYSVASAPLGTTITITITINSIDELVDEAVPLELVWKGTASYY